MPRSLLLKNADLLVTMDPARREIPGGGVYCIGPEIIQVGPTSALPEVADEVIDLAGHILCPGLINTHHHMYQSLTRAVPAARQPIRLAKGTLPNLGGADPGDDQGFDRSGHGGIAGQRRDNLE
jgi:cytosine/adenosine deaminase-related metal-dependent hydrolase